MYYFIIIIIFFLLSTPTRPQPPASTASHHSQQHNYRQPHLNPLQDPPQTNKTQPPATTDQQISTARERNRSHSEPRWARERSASDRRSLAPPRSLLRSPRTTAKLIAREIGSPCDHCESHREAHQARPRDRSAP
jgi:hypothetical protein